MKVQDILTEQQDDELLFEKAIIESIENALPTDFQPGVSAEELLKQLGVA